MDGKFQSAIVAMMFSKLIVSFNTCLEFSNKIESCYGLPYGIFGLICWSLSFFSNFLLYCKIPLFSPWKWGKPYESQSYFFAFIAFTITIGPTIYTCIRCREEWILIVLAIGQLSPWLLRCFMMVFLPMIKNYLAMGFITYVEYHCQFYWVL